MRTIALLVLTGILTMPAIAGEISPAGAMGFEIEGAWMTAPPLTDTFPEEHLWSTRTIPFADLAGGARLSSEQVRQGEASLLWVDHPRYPTIHTSHVPTDWSGYKSLSVWVYSVDQTGQIITIGIGSNNDETTWSDYFVCDFTIDWTGWRQVQLPLADFRPLGSPAGWNAVDGVYFFSKIYGRQPNPYTALYLDDLQLSETEVPSTLLTPEQTAPGRLPLSQDAVAFDPSVLNHRWPELRDAEAARAPIQYQSYFLYERALFGYFPRFRPGPVSFDPEGKPYILSGGHIIQWLDDDGRWQFRDLLAEVIEPYARDTLQFDAINISNTGSGNEVTIRFDDEGDTYILAFISDPTKDWRSRTGLLLHSRDRMQTWDVYTLPYYFARFEKFVGNNDDYIKGPPMLLISRYFAPTEIFITFPEKRPDGTLHIPELIPIADEALPLMAHSGEANPVISHGEEVFIVYSRMLILEGHTQEEGLPAYAVVYNRKTGELSEPVLLGFGGINALDNHNWASLAAGPDGILHVLINGHHDPFRSLQSLRPWDITEWTEPVVVAKATSYGGLICDRAGTLYSVTRNSDPGYYFRLSLHRQKAGQEWEAPAHLALPYKPYYKVWYHKLVIDPTTERLFLFYFSQSPSICVFADELMAYTYIWPDREQSMLVGADGVKLPTGTYRSDERKYQHYGPLPADEPTLLISDDHGETWRLATSEDFR